MYWGLLHVSWQQDWVWKVWQIQVSWRRSRGAEAPGSIRIMEPYLESVQGRKVEPGGRIDRLDGFSIAVETEEGKLLA